MWGMDACQADCLRYLQLRLDALAATDRSFDLDAQLQQLRLVADMCAARIHANPELRQLRKTLDAKLR